jgi:PTS system nitrogen regulatory IIA component
LADVMVDVCASDKRQLIQELARRVASALNLPADQISSELLKREELGSTGMGGGIAIPHARSQMVKKPFGILVKLKPLIDFDAIDRQSVDLVFLLLLPTSADGDPLGALAAVTRKLRSAEDLTRLRAAKNASELYSVAIG